jgi:hypothetical protein
MGWTGLLKSGAGGFFSAGFGEYAKGDQVLVSGSLKNGYIVQVAPVRDYKSFLDFKAAVRALPVSFSLEPVPEARFRALDGEELHVRYGDTPAINGVPVDYSQWTLFNNPFGQSARGSGLLSMNYGSEHYVLDFKKITIKDSFVPDVP